MSRYAACWEPGMIPRTLFVALAVLAASGPVLAEDDRATTTIKLVQEKLHIHGFYSGLIDGNPAGETQAAIARFQLSRSLPADGSPDKRTLDELGVVLEEPASTGASSPPAEGASPETPRSDKPQS